MRENIVYAVCVIREAGRKSTLDSAQEHAVFTLYQGCGRISVGEIARRFGVSKRTVYNIVARVRQREGAANQDSAPMTAPEDAAARGQSTCEGAP